MRVATPSPRLLGVIPETRYAKTLDGVHIAYKVIGGGPSDLVLASWAMNVDALWGWERHADALRRLASFSRVLAFDRRGTGASDHIADRSRQQSLEARMDDIRAVMDAAGSERAVLVGIEDGFALAAMFAATYPERTLALVGWSYDDQTEIFSMPDLVEKFSIERVNPSPARYNFDKSGFPADRMIWEAVVAVPKFRGERLTELALHPITLGFGKAQDCCSLGV